MGNGQPVLSASSMIGNLVKDSQGQELGKVKELIIDPDTGRVVRAVVSRQDPSKLSEQLTSIPWNAITVSERDGGMFVDAQAMDSPRQSEKDGQDFKSSHWSTNVLVYTSSVYKSVGNSK